MAAAYDDRTPLCSARGDYSARSARSDRSPRSATARRQEAAGDMTRTLKEMAPIPGYAGFVRLSRGVQGETFAKHFQTARELRKFPEADAMTSQAWTVPETLRASGRVVLRGKGPRADLQDLVSQTEARQAAHTMVRARAQALPVMADPKLRREPQFKFVERNISFDPGQQEKIDPFTMKRAGAATIGQKQDDLREHTMRLARHRALGDKVWPDAIGR